MTILLTVVGAIFYCFFDTFFSESMTFEEIQEAKDIFLLLLLNIVITLSTMVFRSVINAHERFLFLKGMETVQLVLQPILVIVILQQHPYAFSVALAQTVLNAIRFHYWSSELFADFRKLALSVFAVALIDQCFWKTNQMILGVISGTEAVAVYSIASLIYTNYMVLSTAISGVYLPHITAMVAEEAPISKFSALFIQIGRWQYYLLSLVATGFILFGHRFIRLWAGEGFDEAYGITLLIILPFTIDLIQNIGLAILQAKNQYDFRAKVYLAVGMCNLFLAIPLGMKYGGTGCAFATGLSMFLGNGLIMNWFYAKRIGLGIASFWKQIGHISIVVCICLALGYGMGRCFGNYNSLGSFVLQIIIYTCFYGLFIYAFAMNVEEKVKVQKICMSLPLLQKMVVVLDRGEKRMMQSIIKCRLENWGGTLCISE